MLAITVILVAVFFRTAMPDCNKTLPGVQLCQQSAWVPCATRGFKYYHKSGVKVCLQVFSANVTTLLQATQRCRQKSSNLISIYTDIDQQTVIEALKGQASSLYWLDMEYSTQEKGFRWNQRLNAKLNFTNWASSVNLSDPSAGDCVKLESSTGHWVTADCSSTAPYICQSDNFVPLSTAPTHTIEADEGSDTVYMGNQLKALCYGGVGLDGTLSWEFIKAGTKTHIFVGDPRVETSYVYHTIGGRCSLVLKSCLTLTFAESTADINKTMTINCATHLKSQGYPTCSNPGALCGRASTLKLKYSNREPWLLLDYHDKSRRLLHLGRPAVFECRACVGLTGNVSFETRGEDLGVLDKCGHHDASLTYSKEGIGICGLNVTATLTFPVTFETETCSVRCHSFLGGKGKVQRNKLYADWRSFAATYGPQTPTMSLQYPGRDGLLLPGWHVTVTCEACVADQGDVTWMIINARNDSLSADQLSKLLVSKFVNTTTPRADEPYCGTKLLSSITLTVSTVLHQTRVVCMSQNGTAREDVDFTAVSRVFYVVGKPPPGEFPITTLDLIPPLVFLAVLVMFFLATRYWMDTEEDREQRKNLPSQKRLKRSQGSSRSSLTKRLPRVSFNFGNLASVWSPPVSRVTLSTNVDRASSMLDAEAAERLLQALVASKVSKRELHKTASPPTQLSGGLGPQRSRSTRAVKPTKIMISQKNWDLLRVKAAPSKTQAKGTGVRFADIDRRQSSIPSDLFTLRRPSTVVSSQASSRTRQSKPTIAVLSRVDSDYYPIKRGAESAKHAAVTFNDDA